jgi:hypothetical protein
MGAAGGGKGDIPSTPRLPFTRLTRFNPLRQPSSYSAFRNLRFSLSNCNYRYILKGSDDGV